MVRGAPLLRALTILAVAALAACTQAPPPVVAPAPTAPILQETASLVRIRKGARILEVWSGPRRVLLVSGIQLGRDPIGPKRFEGDGRTPEGRYRIDWRNPHSAYHLSLHISYPDASQTLAARANGRSAGGMIMIHGQPNGYQGRVAGDWTDGCIAVSDAEIETLWNLVPDGSTLEILP